MKKKLVALSVPLLAAGLLGGIVLSGVASANLPGSTFESNDGNMVVDHAGNTDWVNAPNLVVGTDLPSGPTDNSFGRGTQENDVNVTVVTGSIPNSKADLGRFGVANEQLASNGHQMLYLAWTRNNLSGTTNFDFEINKLKQPDLTTAGAKTLNRSVGDLLISFDFQGGAQHPTLTSHVWNGTVWGPGVVLGSTVSEGAVNAVTIPEQLGTQPGPNLIATEFGEAGIDLTAAGLVPPPGTAGSCLGFASAFVKSRASDSFSSEIKDFIAPVGINLKTCGTIVIKKVTVPSPNPLNTSFNFTLTGGVSALNKSFSLKDGQSNTTTNVDPGNGYVAAETVPTGWDLTSATCDNGSPVTNIVVTANTTTTCTFTNTLEKGAVAINKQAKHAASGPGDHPQAGVTFTVTNATNGTNATVVTDANGNACVPNLTVSALDGNYTVTESLPAGYVNDTPLSQSYTVVTGTTCATATPLAFHNIPLTNITTSVASQVDGGTSSTITCADSSNNTVASGATDSHGNGSATAPNLVPGTYTCTVVVDP
jgi:hypothetical protein